ncbi:MAG: pyridoxal-phosphate dependent enzyme [Legionellaceae bacterium]|nr:pyridoxal-phosphate dependent enzyme [Legionellaceae bacterium]
MTMSPLHINTPVIYSQFLQNTIGKSVYFKLDALQPTASFKIRGIGRLCQHYASQGVKQFVASSGGNAGISVAYCGMILDIPTTVFIPSTSHQLFINEIKSYGADVVVAGDVWDEAHLAALQFAEEHHAAYIPPFDHPIIWGGHATMIKEIADTGLRPEAIVAAVGGGGLACGLLEGMRQQGWDDIPLIAVETLGADCFYQSIQANQLITLEKITSKATSLGAKHVTPRLMEWTRDHVVKPVVVTDAEAEAGARAFAKDKRILVELSAGAALSIAYSNHPIIQEFHSILMVVCGGINTSFFQL